MVTIDAHEASGLAQHASVSEATVVTLGSDPAVRALLHESIEAVNANFATIEQVKRFAVLQRGLTQADGELTPTLKVRRAAVNERYRDRFEALYSAAAGADQVVGGETP